MIDINFDDINNFEKTNLKKFIEKSMNKILDEIDNNAKNIYISIFLTDNKKIKKINNKYRKINKVTNVLSFPQNDERTMNDFKIYLILGDIVISLERIYSESKEQKKTFLNHLLHMIIHRTLHLYGYDHKNMREAKIMEKKENDILFKVKELIVN